MSEIIDGKNIPLFNKGKIKRDYLYIDDAVKSIYLSLVKIKKIKFEILNIGGGNPTSAVTLFNKIKKICKSKSNIVYSKTKNKSIIKNIFMDLSQAKKIINYKSNTLENNLRKMYYEYKKK
jgi:nucleoside-diphosphate-sugar epimerase